MPRAERACSPVADAVDGKGDVRKDRRGWQRLDHGGRAGAAVEEAGEASGGRVTREGDEGAGYGRLGRGGFLRVLRMVAEVLRAAHELAQPQRLRRDSGRAGG